VQRKVTLYEVCWGSSHGAATNAADATPEGQQAGPSFRTWHRYSDFVQLWHDLAQ
jgi:hypothetical protein